MRYVLIFCLLGQELIVAQSQEWAVRYNGPVNVVDGGTSIAVDILGNVYVTGRRGDTPASFECTTIKYDPSGNEKWVRAYRASDSTHYDTGWGIALDDFGHVYVTAASTDSFTGDDIAVIKYDTLGNFVWATRYNGPGNDYDWPFDIEVDAAGNVYVTGRSVGAGTGFDYVTIKWDSSGTEKWVGRYNGTGNLDDEAYSIAVDVQGNVYTTGTSTGAGTGLDFATIKYDSSGDEVWAVRFNTTGEMDEYGTTLDIDDQGNVYITGGTWKFMQGIPSDYLTIKYNANGDTVWTRRYNGPGNDDDAPEEIVYDGRGNVYIAGDSWGGSGTRTDFCTVKYDTLGNEIWVRRYDGPVHQNDQTRAIAIDIRGNVYVTGESRGSVDNDYASVVYDSLGTQITAQRYDGPGTWADAPQDIIADENGNFYITGFSGGLNTAYDFCTIKYSGMPGIKGEGAPAISSMPVIQTLFTGSLHLPEGKSCAVFDITGREVDVNYMSPGIYFLEINGRVTAKIVKLK
jgi:hypothetical protein